MDTIPIPTPPTIRAITRRSKVGAKLHHTAEVQKSIAEMVKLFFRPKLSLKIPPIETPIIDPIKAQPTYQPSEMVSKPNILET